MAFITLRQANVVSSPNAIIKGSPLSNSEVDNNFANLNIQVSNISELISNFGTGVVTFLGNPTSANLAAAVTNETGTGALVFATSPTLVTPALGTPSSANLVSAIGLPIDAGTTGTLPVARGGTGIISFGTGIATFLGDPTSANLAAAVTDETGTGALVFATSPTLVTPALGTPVSGNIVNTTGLPIDAGTTGTLPVARGGTGGTTSTGTGAVVLATSPTLVTPALGTPSSANLVSAVSLPIDAGTTGTLSVARGGTGGTTSTGSGAVVLATSPTLVTPALGTPASGNLINCVGFPEGGSGSGLFNTAINDLSTANATTSFANVYAAPATADKRYIIHSIHLTNIDSVDSEITGQFVGSTYSDITFATTIPLPVGSSVELLKKPKILQPSDSIQLLANANDRCSVTVTIEESNDIKFFGRGIDIVTEAILTDLYVATANSVVESILLSNDDSTLDVKARVAITNASNVIQSHLAFELIVPADATIEVLEQPKFIPSGFKVQVQANQPNRLEAIIAGKTV